MRYLLDYLPPVFAFTLGFGGAPIATTLMVAALVTANNLRARAVAGEAAASAARRAGHEALVFAASYGFVHALGLFYGGHLW